MSLNCVRDKKQTYFWASLLLATIIGCGILVYMSYVYKGGIKVPCRNCKDPFVSPPEKLTQEKCQQACYTEECIQAASSLLQNMNASADPCEDFYSFACGGMLGKFGEDETHSMLLQMQRSMKTTFKDILENLKEPYDDVTRKVKIVYDSCMSVSASETNAVPSALEFLRGVGIGGWPFLENDFSFSNLSLEEVIAKMAAYHQYFALDFFFPSDYERHSEDEALHNITIKASQALLNSHRRDKYKKVVLQILDYFEVANEKANQIWEDFKSVDVLMPITLENLPDTTIGALEYLMWRMDSSTSEFSCKENQNEIQISLCSILRLFVLYTNSTQSISTEFFYLESEQNVLTLIRSLKRARSHREVANYLAVRFFLHNILELSTVFRVSALEYPELFTRGKNSKPSINKWEDCIDWLYLHLPLPLSKIYLLNTVLPNQTEEVNNIFTISRQATANLTNQQLWIENTQRKELRNVIENTEIGLEDMHNYILEWASFYLQEFHPTNESFLWNSLEHLKSNMKLLSRVLDPKTGFQEKYFDPLDVNAYNFDDRVELNLGIISPPVFQYGLPKLLNLATLSPLIGHEIGHQIFHFLAGIDANSSTYEEGVRKLNCLRKQYSNFTLKKIGKKVDNITIYENALDLIGNEIAEKILKKYLEQEHLDSSLVLPAVELSTKQLLYVSMAQLWCDTASEKDELLRYEKDNHANPEARLIITYRNLKGFSEAFSCPIGSSMNPLHKCSFFDDYAQ